MGIGRAQLNNLQTNGYLQRLPTYDSNFRATCSSLEVKHRLAKPLWIVHYPIFVSQGDGRWPDTVVDLPISKRWSQFSRITDNGAATRSVQVHYAGAQASYVYCVTENNNDKESWVKLDGREAAHQREWGSYRKKFYNYYPANIELGGRKPDPILRRR